MILKRVETDVKIKAIYESSNILASTYEPSKKDLTIIFKRGASYTYKNVDKTDYFRFETADSQGEVLNKHLKKYDAVKNDAVDVKKIEDEILNLREEEINKYKGEVVDYLKDVVETWNQSGKLKSDDLDRILIMNNKLKELVK
jgi:hypothetical protein